MNTSSFSPRQQYWGMAAVIAVFAFLLYANTIGHEYALDDFSTITENNLVQEGMSGIPAMFTTPYSHGDLKEPGESYRPFTLATFAVEWSISPSNPHLGHVVNVLLYALSCMLIFVVFAQILGKEILLFPFFVALLFVAHPIHVEVVANIKSRDEILAFLGGLSAIYFLWKFWDTNRYLWLGAGLLAYTCALFSKENAVTFLMIFPLVYWFFREEFSVKALAWSMVFMVPVCLYIWARGEVLAGIGDRSVSDLNNIIAGADTWSEGVATAMLFIGKYLLTLVFPHPLGTDFGFNQISLTDWGDWRVLLTSLVVLALSAYAVRTLFNKRQIWGFAILFFFINLTLFSNVIIQIGTQYGDRLLYAGSLGFVLALAFAIFKFVKNQQLMIACFGVILLLYSAKTITRNMVWKDNLTLFISDIRISPNSAKLNYRFGTALAEKAAKTNNPLQKEERYQQSIKYLNRALDIYPRFPDAAERLGLTYLEQGRGQEALDQFKKSLEYDPSNTSIYRHIGAVYMERNEFNKAKAAYQKAVDAYPGIVEAWQNLGNMNAMDGKFKDAIRCYTHALELAPDNAMVNFQLGNLYKGMGMETEAGRYLDKAVSLDPGLGE